MHENEHAEATRIKSTPGNAYAMTFFNFLSKYTRILVEHKKGRQQLAGA